MREDLKALSDKQLQEKLYEIEKGIAKEIESLKINYLHTENDPLEYLSQRIQDSQKEIANYSDKIEASNQRHQDLVQQGSQNNFYKVQSISHETELNKEKAQLNSLQQLKKLLEGQNEITEEQALRKATQAATPSAVTPSSPEQSPSFLKKIKSEISSFFESITQSKYAHGDAVQKIIRNTTTAPKEKTISHLTVSRRGVEAEHAKIPTTTSLQRTQTLSNNSESSQSFSRKESVVSQNPPKRKRNAIATPDQVALQRTETLSNNSASARSFSRRESVVSQGTIKPERNANATQDWSAKQNKMDITKFLELLNPPLDAATKIEQYNKTKLTIEGEITALSLEKSLEHYKKLDDTQKEKLIESLRKHNVEFQSIFLITKVTGENNAGRLLIGIISQINTPIKATPTPINVSANQEPESSSNTSQSTLLATTEITAGKDPKQPGGSNEIQQPQQPKPIAVSSGYAAEKPRSRKRADSAQPILSTSNKNEFLVDFSKIENALRNSKTLPQEKMHEVRKILLHLHDSELNELKRIAIEGYEKDLKKTTSSFFSKKESEFKCKEPDNFLEFSKTNDRAFKHVLATQKLFEKRLKDPSYQHERAVAARANHQEYEKNLKEIAKKINDALEKNISSQQIHELASLLKITRQEDYLTIVGEIVKIQPREKDHEKQIRFCGFLSEFGLENFSSAQEIINKTKNIILNQLNNSVDLESFRLTLQENVISGMLVSEEEFNKKHKELLENFEKAQRDAAMQKEQAEFTALENNSAMSILGISEITTRDALKKEEWAEFILLENSLNETPSSASSVGAPSKVPNTSTLFQPSRDNDELCKVDKALSPIFESMIEICNSKDNEETTFFPAVFFCKNPDSEYEYKKNFHDDVTCAKMLYAVLNNSSQIEKKITELKRICSNQIKAHNDNALNFTPNFSKYLLLTEKNLTSLKSPTSSLQTFPSTSSLPTP